jgi:hypothetical protein
MGKAFVQFQNVNKTYYSKEQFENGCQLLPAAIFDDLHKISMEINTCYA